MNFWQKHLYKGWTYCVFVSVCLISWLCQLQHDVWHLFVLFYILHDSQLQNVYGWVAPEAPPYDNITILKSQYDFIGIITFCNTLSIALTYGPTDLHCQRLCSHSRVVFVWFFCSYVNQIWGFFHDSVNGARNLIFLNQILASLCRPSWIRYRSYFFAVPPQSEQSYQDSCVFYIIYSPELSVWVLWESCEEVLTDAV